MIRARYYDHREGNGAVGKDCYLVQVQPEHAIIAIPGWDPEKGLSLRRVPLGDVFLQRSIIPLFDEGTK